MTRRFIALTHNVAAFAASAPEHGRPAKYNPVFDRSTRDDISHLIDLAVRLI
jgi:hypothetical protein